MNDRISPQTERPADTIPLGGLLLVSAFLIGLLFLLGNGLHQHFRSLHENHSPPPSSSALNSAPQMLFRILLQGQAPLILEAAEAQQFIHTAGLHTTALHDAANAHLETWTNRQIRIALGQSEGAVDAYLDWYYSLSGSYLRLLLAARGDLDNLLSRKMETLLFEQGQLDQQLLAFGDTLQQGFCEELYRFLQQQQAVSLDALYGEFHTQQIQLSQTEQTALPQITDIEMNPVLHTLFSPSRADIQTQWPAAAYGLAAGPALAMGIRHGLLSSISASPASRAARQATQRYLARLPAQLGARAALSAQTTAAASPSGPIALAIGAGVFAAAIGVDWAMLKAEEASYREAQKQAFLQSIQAHLQAQTGNIVAAQNSVFGRVHAQLIEQQERIENSAEFRIF
ncbi:MAG: hypothetical protein K0A95_05405 [Chromatiales bacterium]|nr:hypothetical protein [Gammaproteobacteria bacterium]MBW6476493.1 hypothetical protein [Chromatiales bacterium]